MLGKTTAAEREAMQLAEKAQAELTAVAHEMVTLWHFPWRTYVAWPTRLRQVAQGWLRGDLAPARHTGIVKFRDILQAIPVADHSANRHVVADFVLLLGNTLYQTARHAEDLDGDEAIDALEAVSCFMVLVRTRYDKIFAPHVGEEVGRVAQKIMTLVGEMRGYPSADTGALNRYFK